MSHMPSITRPISKDQMPMTLRQMDEYFSEKQKQQEIIAEGHRAHRRFKTFCGIYRKCRRDPRQWDFLFQNHVHLCVIAQNIINYNNDTNGFFLPNNAKIKHEFRALNCLEYVVKKRVKS